MDVDELLTSTRSARRTLATEAPVDLDVVRECLGLALHAANGTNQQSWRWLVVTDPEKRRVLAGHYRDGYLEMTGGLIADQLPDDAFGRIMTSTEWLVEHLAEVPVFVIPCYRPYLPSDGAELFQAATLYGSIFPAVWNLQLALRSRGYGSCITTLHLRRAAEVAELLGIPEGFTQGCLLPVARLRDPSPRPAPRKPLAEVTAIDHWDGPPLEEAP